MKLPIFITALISATAITAGADNAVPQSPTAGLSPNARSFQRYGEIPVSLYTGTPLVSIPLGSLRDGELSLPIELSYHSGGIKADEHPGWTGLGWTLMAGGAITREEYDLPDELDELGFFYKRAAINGLDKTPDKVDDIFSSIGQTPVFSFDLQPDKFNFHFPGYSGFFMMDSKGQWHVSCERPLKVESYTLTGPFNLDQNLFPAHNSKIISSFTLTGDDGVRYTFGIDAIDLSINIRRQAAPAWEANAWYLKKIEHPNGDCFLYSYERKKFTVNFSNNGHYTYMSDRNGNPIAASIPESAQGMLIYPVYLSKIEGSTFKATFAYSESTELRYSDSEFMERIRVDFDDEASRPIYFTETDINNHMSNVGWYKLDAVHLYSGNDRYKSIRFNYSADSNMRLMLNGIDIQGADQNIFERYAFRYHCPEKMPAYLSGETDHWGYYNGIKNDIDSPMTTNITDGLKVRYGSLREIVYPTGGKTVFEFEANTYSRVSNTVSCGDLTETDESLAGGLRIKRIYDVPNDSSAVRVREYRYTRGYCIGHSDEKSSGILECPPEYQIKTPYDNGALMIEFSDSPLSNIVNSYGYHIGYQEVTELDGSGGYTIHRFTSCADSGYMDQAPLKQSAPSKFVPLTSKAAYRGLPCYEAVYDSSGQKLRERTISYSIPTGEADYVHSFNVQLNEIPRINSHNEIVTYLIYSLYKIFTYNLKTASVEDRIYEHSLSPVVINRFYRYNTFNQLRSDSTITMRKGHQTTDVTNYRYAWENDDIFSKSFLLSYPSSTEIRHNGKKLHEIITRYSLAGNSPYISTITKYLHGGGRQTIYSCLYADSKGKPLLVKDSDGLLTAYIWGADGLYPVSSISMPDMSVYRRLLNLNVQVSPTVADLHALFTNLRNALPDAMVTGYIYRPWPGLTSLTDPAGKETTYEYDTFGRLISIKNPDGNTITAYGYSTATTETSTTGQ